MHESPQRPYGQISILLESIVANPSFLTWVFSDILSNILQIVYHPDAGFMIMYFILFSKDIINYAH